MDQKETYHEEKVFEILERWERAEAPEYLETRIMARLDTIRPVPALKWGWAALLLILLGNGIAVARYLKQSAAKTPGYIEYLQTNPELENYYTRL